MNLIDMSKVFRALSCKKRLGIVQLLLEQESCVGAIAESLNASQSSISQHLRVLRDSGLVTDHRDGYHIHYRANREVLHQLTNNLSEMVSTGKNDTECKRKGKLCAEDAIVSIPKTS